MTASARPDGGLSADGCAELRATVDAACAAAHDAKEAHERAGERSRGLRREVTAAQRAREEATQTADPALRSAQKAAARDTYRLALVPADADGVREATAVYAKTLDRVNREANLARRAVHEATRRLEQTESAAKEAEREEQAARLRADQAEAACLDARVRLAACEEGATSGPESEHATVFEPHAATGGHAVGITAHPAGPPLVIESLISGDRVALELAAARMAEHTGLTPAESQLQLQELVAAIVSAAAHDGFLAFDPDHHFWSELSFEEARDVIAALDRLGFVFEPDEGWHAGRAPAPPDLAMALAYAGLDSRHMRDLPTADELLALPASIGVDARAFLAARAPQLTVDNVVRALDRRAAALEGLWDEWGQVRPILLSDRHSLGSVPG
jgi:hypothetical protein